MMTLTQRTIRRHCHQNMFAAGRRKKMFKALVGRPLAVQVANFVAVYRGRVSCLALTGPSSRMLVTPTK